MQRSSGRRRSSAGKFPEFFRAFKNYLISKGEEGVAPVSPKLVMHVGKGWEGRSRATIEKYVDAKVV